MTEYERLKLKIADLKEHINQLQEQRDNFYKSMLLWRNIDTEQGDIVCKKCINISWRLWRSNDDNGYLR